MRMANRSAFRAALVAGAVAGFAAAASADVSRTIFSVTATNTLGTDSYTFQLPEGIEDPFINGVFDWIFSNPITLPNTGVVINGASVHLQADPIVSLSFDFANTANVDSNIAVVSPLLSFAAINGAVARASADLTVTDSGTITGGEQGATLSPLGGQGYTAFYNGGAPQTGTEFASFFTSSSVIPATGPFGSTQTFHSDTGPLTAVGNVFDASSRFQFSITPKDAVSGTSTFEIIPGPGSLALLGLGSLVAVRRRR